MLLKKAAIISYAISLVALEKRKREKRGRGKNIV